MKTTNQLSAIQISLRRLWIGLMPVSNGRVLRVSGLVRISNLLTLIHATLGNGRVISMRTGLVEIMSFRA
jgi:hypothetical protein